MSKVKERKGAHTLLLGRSQGRGDYMKKKKKKKS